VLETGMTVAAHAHEHEQAGHVISGRCRQIAAGAVNELGLGDSYVIAGGIEHAMEVLEGGHVIDVFTPPREDYR
jgi:quercetin dioxygenase-like cupin family protein